MIPNDVVPGHVKETIWDMMKRCALSEEEELQLKDYVDSKGMIYLCTPFCGRRGPARADAGACLQDGSGECNNYPLIKHIARYGKPVILSTGMNNLESIAPAVGVLREAGIPFALMHCTSMYPTPYDKVRLGAYRTWRSAFPMRW